jgi:hypothetical protein
MLRLCVVVWLLLRTCQFKPLTLQDVLYIISNLIACICLPYASEQGDYSAGRTYPLGE